MCPPISTKKLPHRHTHRPIPWRPGFCCQVTMTMGNIQHQSVDNQKRLSSNQELLVLCNWDKTTEVRLSQCSRSRWYLKSRWFLAPLHFKGCRILEISHRRKPLKENIKIVLISKVPTPNPQGWRSYAYQIIAWPRAKLRTLHSTFINRKFLDSSFSDFS